MANMIKLDIVTPDKKVFEGEIKSLMAPGIDGEFGILPGHAPFATALAPGVVELKKPDNTQELMAVSGGYIEVAHDKAVLLVETVDKAGEYDIERIKRNKEEQEKLLKSKTQQDVDYDRIQLELVREMSRLKAVELLARRGK
ncbi:MAG: ATP synthase epsilon chain [Candidatus Aerophobetes bacterium ADurb.Bin490]|nr:MAG: ATP synthase epsilon chain [Candidatus Aerophobetes bacterium ADurb.Bin490]HPI03605.1 ATP synthase F1 subunit epsilon [Candidatus Goldiibacteriota bacterium]HPN65378.1 ATP synthase F1 subunit epsilon [Candidatus Goldiibacteriota bacterium]HRQ44893.1 ATP synthase F1 subunit epsilon [Candidatus Goldiibacteriota bacterium]